MRHGMHQGYCEAYDERKRLQLPLGNEAIEQLRAGDFVLLSGILYTGRDAAHIRMRDAIEKENLCRWI